MAAKFQPDKFWRERVGARTEACKQAVLNAAVSVDDDGVKQEWGAVLPSGTGTGMTLKVLQL